MAGHPRRAMDKVWRRRPACGFWQRPAGRSGRITRRDARSTRRRGRLRYFVNGPAPAIPPRQAAMNLSRRVLLIANPAAAAGRMARCWERLLAELSSRRIKADRQVTVRPGHAVALAQAATRSYDVVVAVGGDGTVNEVASGILLAGETTAVLGVVPLGTGNDLAHLLGIRSMEDAINALVSGTGRAMDAIEV